jgi:flagellar hook assembly protein FlgD
MRQSKIFTLVFLSSIFAGAPVFAAAPQAHLELRADPTYFSPNGDGSQDALFFHPVLSGASGPQRWRLDIFNHKHRRIDRITGPGLPALLKWDGMDKKNARLPDGEYQVRLDVYGHGFHATAQEKITIDVQTPVVGMTVSTSVYTKSLVSTETLKFYPTIFDNSPTARWFIQILNETGRTIQVFSSTGPLHEVEWDGSDPTDGIWAAPGTYHCAVTAWDQAGNESVPFLVDVKVNTDTRELLEHSLKYIRVNETESGLLVQLKDTDLFRVRKGRLVWAPNAAVLLNEVSILANAYPNAPLKLEGYVKTKKRATKDRKLASVYAWRVYSYLVKDGHVTASRLSVRGRGRSAMFDRRAIPVPVMTNGVEIFLEGNGPW